MTKIRTSFLSSFLLLSIFAFGAKPKWQLQVEGTVMTYDASQVKNVDALTCKVTLYCDSVKIKELVNPDAGGFSFLLDPEHDYIISATSDGCINQKVLICTKDVPENRTNRAFAKLTLTLIVFPTFPDYNYAFLDKPLVRIAYNFSSSVEDFDYDLEYEMAMSKDVEKEKELNDIANRHLTYDVEIKRGDALFNLAKWDDAKSAYLGASANLPFEKYPKDQVAKCDEKLAVIKKAQEEKDRQYAMLLAVGDSLFAKKDFRNAKVNYQQASNLHPELFYPKSRIAECDQNTNGGVDDATMEKKYAELLASADKLFSQKDYDGAKFKYNQASKLKPNENYPKDQIAKCDLNLKTITDNSDVDKKYQDLISMADNLFSAKDWAEAKTNYQQASDLKPNEQYPKDRIKICQQQIDAANKPK